MLRSDIERCIEVRCLARDAADDDDALRIRRRDAVGEKVRDGELRRAARVRDVDVECSVAVRAGRVLGLCTARRMPEVAPVRVV